jgi:alginate O-acetyltransferase complex protein AlgI
MLFNSIEFMIFFPLVTILYFLLPHRLRWLLLLLSSCIFYMFFIPAYILILAITIVVDYFVGIQINKMEGNKKRIFLIISIISNVGFLFVFKYFNFFNDNITHLATFLHWNYPIKSLSIILPIGLSFHTFQSMSYIIEVYRGKQKPEKHFGIYALYVMFYPQLVAGPIERPQNLLHQFHEKHYFDSGRIIAGLRLMLWGMFKKVVIADNLAIIVESVYKNPSTHSGLTLIIATYFFAFQIYCDFSGYTDIARGAAKVMGFGLMENFRRPYFSKSISEFWKRWHISLSSWFKDYVYISLGGSRCSNRKWYRNLMIVFVLSGLWHGANWTYIIWGALNGFYLVFALISEKARFSLSRLLKLDKVPIINKMIKVFITFNLICFSWIFFRSKSIHDALFIVKHIFTDIRLKLTFSWVGISRYDLLICTLLIGFLLIVQLLQRKGSLSSSLEGKPILIRWGLYYAAITAIILLGVFTATSFIYFQF